MRVLKRSAFAKWQLREKLPDAVLCWAVMEMEHGLIDADLGGKLYKKRVPGAGRGKSRGYRTLLSARIGSRYIFLHGFPKSEQSNISPKQKQALSYAGQVFLALSDDDLVLALQTGVLQELHCDRKNH